MKTLLATLPTLRRIEVAIKPRLSALTAFPLTIIVGIQTLLMAFILILPIPFANWPPGMTVAMTALALLQRDGLLMLITIPRRDRIGRIGLYWRPHRLRHYPARPGLGAPHLLNIS